MRLPWPFNRSQRAPAQPGSVASVGTGARLPLGEWRGLPPIQATIQPAPLIAPNEPFAADLRAAHPPEPVLGQLGHGHSLTAPVGLVVGLARPVTSDAAAERVDRPVRHIQRSAIGSAPTPDLEPATVEQPVPEPLAVTPRRLAVVDAKPSAAPLDRVTDDAAPPLALARPAGVVGPAQVAGSVRPVSAPRPAPEPPAITPVSKHAPKSEGAVDSTPPARLTVGQVRRLGLGAPISRKPMADPIAAPPVAVPTPTLPPRPEPAPATPSATVSQRAPVAARRLSPPTVAGATSPAATSAPAKPNRPILNPNALRGHVQRAPRLTTGAARDAQEAAGMSAIPVGSGDGPVRVHRGEQASQLAGAVEARAFTHQGEIYLPSSAGPINSSSARSLLAHEMTHVVQQRALGSNLPPEDSPHGRSLEAQARAAESGAAQPLPLAGPSGGAADPTGAAPEAASIDAAGTMRAPVKPDEDELREDETGSATIQLSASTQRAEISSGPVGAPRPRNKQATEQELDDLARQLYGRIRTRMRRELIADRERSGVLVDTR